MGCRLTVTVFEALDDLAQIAPDGDLILVVGKEGKRGIQVHSLMLKSASPVFEVMLSDKFSEGRRLRESQGPMRLDLPEDDYDAVHNACSVLHGNDGSKKNLTAMEVHMLAVLIDKYDMSERFFFATAYWLRVLQGVARNSFQDCWYLLTAAYILSSETHFFTYSELLGRRVESCANLAYEIEDLELGLKLCRSSPSHFSSNE